MRKRLKLGRPSHGTVVAYLALFVAIGGSAYATKQLPKNSVGTKQLKMKSVGTKQLKGNAVTKNKIKKNQIVTAKIKGGAITTTKVQNNAVTNPKIANNAVSGAKVDESTLGQVPSAASASNAGLLDGMDSSDYVTKPELLWALIDADISAASIVRSRGAVAASSPDTGRYLVSFNRNIAACGVVATLGDATASVGSPGEISLDEASENSIEVT